MIPPHALQRLLLGDCDEQRNTETSGKAKDFSENRAKNEKVLERELEEI